MVFANSCEFSDLWIDKHLSFLALTYPPDSIRLAAVIAHQVLVKYFHAQQAAPEAQEWVEISGPR